MGPAFRAFFKHAQDNQDVYRQVGKFLLDKDIPIIKLPDDPAWVAPPSGKAN